MRLIRGESSSGSSVVGSHFGLYSSFKSTFPLEASELTANHCQFILARLLAAPLPRLTLAQACDKE